MERGKLIVLEGLDGSGKTLQAHRLFEEIRRRDLSVRLTREASDGPIGRLIRYEYLSGKRISDPRITNLLYAVDRLDHITNEADGMLQWIENGYHVVCDRYYLSSLAYYGSEYYETPEFEEQVEFIYRQNAVNLELLRPDLTVILSVPPEECIRRLKSSRRAFDIYETEDHLRKVMATYEYVTKKYADEHTFVIDGVGHPDLVEKTIWEIIQLHLKIGCET